MFLQGRLARILGTIMAAFSFVPWARHAAAKSYVLAENPCVRYHDDWSPGDCTFYTFEGCAENCIPVWIDKFFITGSTDPRDLQALCLEIKDNGNGGYDYTGFTFTGSDEFGSYTVDVSGCLWGNSPLETGLYGYQSCEGSGESPYLDPCLEENWAEFRACVNNLGCILVDQFNNNIHDSSCDMSYAWDGTACGLVTGYIVCSNMCSGECTLYDQSMEGCMIAGMSCSAEFTRDAIKRECGDIVLPGGLGTYNDISSYREIEYCGTGYLL